jgi:hypothetical protein
MSGDSDDSKGTAAPGASQPGGGEAGAQPPARLGEDAKPDVPAPASEGSAPGAERKPPAQRKTVKRKIKATRQPQSAPVQTPSGAASDEAAAKPSGKPRGKPPADAAPATDKAADGDSKPGADAAAAAGRPTPPHAIAAGIERGAATSEPDERRGSSLLWLLLLVLLVLVGAGYWLWQHQGLERLQSLITPQETPSTEAEPQREEVELPDPPALPLAQIVEIEELLDHLSFDPGEIDGIVDDRTRAAISRFQELDGQEVDGEPSEALLDALREVTGFQDDEG